VIRGQAAEIALTSGGDIRREAYLRAIEGKTSALFVLPVEGAAKIVGVPGPEIGELAASFRTLGVIFQLQDDVLDLYGDKGREAAGADLREGKVSALVVEHLTLHPADREWLVALLRAPRDATPDDEIARAIARFRDGGALTAVAQHIHGLRRAASEADVFSARPRLGELFAELTALVLRPIEHVL
jgi:geranylgeranyl diphosphate synthase type I